MLKDEQNIPNKSKKAPTKSQERKKRNGAITSPFGPIINMTNS